MSGGAGGGAGAVVRQGHLRKLKTMKKKFFVLRAETVDCSARLEYYESEKKFRAGAAPRRVLPLKSCYNIMRRLDLKQKHVIALFTREEQFCIVAENEQDLHAWLAAILKQHRSDDVSEELQHPIQHVWQVNVQKKGLGATKNIQGLYNLCLTDKTLTLVKIKSHNNVISDLGIPERVEYSLKNIRRCGDSECFFYLDVGRQTTTGGGELWMHTEDSNIAQSMHSTIYHAMRNCAREIENERDHIILPTGEQPSRTRSNSDVKPKVGLSADSQNNTLTDKTDAPVRLIKHHRTESLPTGCIYQEPLKIEHERTRSAPLTGDEVDRILLEKNMAHSSCKAVNGERKTQWSRRASTGTRWSKLSPAHSKNAGPLRSRCDSMPSRTTSTFEVERPQAGHRFNDLEGPELSRDETDATAGWYRTPRIPEEPDCCDTSKDIKNTSPMSGSSIAHSRTSSLGEGGAGYLPMAPGHEPLAGLISASSGSLCSGTPSTDPRFSEYQLDPATSHIGMEARPPRAYSVGSRPGGGGAGGAAGAAEGGRHRAYSVGARQRPPRHSRPMTEDHMLIDFSSNSPANRVSSVARTPPIACYTDRPKPNNADEYVDMSPRNAGYVEMKPGEPPATPSSTDGYVEMNYGRAATRPIAIETARPDRITRMSAAASPDEPRKRATPHGSQTLFDISLDSPADQVTPPIDLTPLADEPAHALTTVRELSEDGRKSPDVAASPQYVTLAPRREDKVEMSGNPTANKTIARLPDLVDSKETITTATLVVAAGAAGAGAAARFSVEPAAEAPAAPLHYAALDLEPRRAPAQPPPRAYTQIDFVRSEKLHADAS